MRKFMLVITTVMMLFFTACGGAKVSSSDNNEPTAYKYTAKMNILGVTYQPQGVSIIKDGSIYYSAWEDDSMEIICNDPACEHKNYTCSAKVGYNAISLVQGGKRLIIAEEDPTIELVNSTDRVIYHKSSLVEADMDGTNQKKVKDLNCIMPMLSGIVYDNKLYIGSKCTTYEHRMDNGLVYDEISDSYVPNLLEIQTYDYVILCVDLISYETTEVYKSEGIEGALGIRLYADENAVYALLESIDYTNEDYTITESSYALYQIDGVNITKIKGESLTNLSCYPYGVMNGNLYFRYATYVDCELGEYDGIFRIADGQVQKIDGKSFIHGIADQNTYVSTWQDDGKLRYDFYELDSDKLVDSIIYDRGVAYNEIFWGKVVYMLEDFPETHRYYFDDIKDIRDLGKYVKFLYN